MGDALYFGFFWFAGLLCGCAVTGLVVLRMRERSAKQAIALAPSMGGSREAQ